MLFEIVVDICTWPFIVTWVAFAEVRPEVFHSRGVVLLEVVYQMLVVLIDEVPLCEIRVMLIFLAVHLHTALSLDIDKAVVPEEVGTSVVVDFW